jgi:hypothetical protein
MDLSQVKLSKAEWTSIEVSVPDKEREVLTLIMDGYETPNICVNTTKSLFSHIKIEPNSELEYYLYKEYFESVILETLDTQKKTPTMLTEWIKSVRSVKCKPLNKSDMIRVGNVKNTIQTQRYAIFEFVLLDFCAGVLGVKKEKNPLFYLYSLVQFKKSTIARLNKYIVEFMDLVIANVYPLNDPSTIRDVFTHSTDYIEKNPHLIQYEDLTLYSHQKQLFRLFKTDPRIPKLVLYMAPTGTGKTMSPIGLSQKHRIIFVCVARHVGLALAKSAISMGKKVAFAFGCETASDIRLHYFAAKDYKINKRSGGIGKVDNSVGDKVEIMICDVASYLTAMYYMLAFNDEHKIITYWDEPTITMDKDDDPLHEIIHRNWCENKISNVVLSCATLPKHSEISSTLTDFQLRFAKTNDETGEDIEPEIHTIDSYDCKKTITLMNKEGRCVLPHLLFENYRDVLRCVEHCEKNKSLLRYFNVAEIVRFILYTETSNYLTLTPETHFRDITNITMNSLKLYYMNVLKSLPAESWTRIYIALKTTLKPHFKPNLVIQPGNMRKIHSMDTPPVQSSGTAISRTISMSSVLNTPGSNISSSSVAQRNATDGILLTTRDAYTLTDGPTIFLAEDIDKIGKFYIQQSKIPESVFQSIMDKIERNSAVQRRIDLMEKELADKKGENGIAETKERSKKAEREPMDKETQRFMEQIATMREQISMITMNPAYVPNTKQHQDIWVPSDQPHVRNAFVPNIDEEDVREIMGIQVDNQKKLLLILGIGVFTQQSNPQYAEVMKRLAYEQRLFLIIASSDYIYGTNYQFCHGFIGKDLANMTQQKTIQAIGRIGRNNIQNEYTVRFRDDAILLHLFSTIEQNKEAVVMSRLFCDNA